MMFLQQFEGFLKTPSLWTGKQFGLKQFNFPEVEISKLMIKPFAHKLRLGHQMEHVFKQVIEQNESYQLLVFNLPIKNTERTIGEIDFILKNIKNQELIHVELTYKFYLIDGKISNPIHQLVGPNRKDLFFTKMEKIKTKQFELLHTNEGIKALQEKHIDHSVIQHRACYKAQLFSPYRSKQIDIYPLNNNSIIGFWISYNDFRSDKFHSFRYYVPNKAEWVVNPHNVVHWKSHSNILTEINLKIAIEISPMVWIKKSETSFEKCFVVWW